ncbi:unnamed protein product [Sympodiomycopsis kandeliae]
MEEPHFDWDLPNLANLYSELSEAMNKVHTDMTILYDNTDLSLAAAAGQAAPTIAASTQAPTIAASPQQPQRCSAQVWKQLKKEGSNGFWPVGCSIMKICSSLGTDSRLCSSSFEQLGFVPVAQLKTYNHRPSVTNTSPSVLDQMPVPILKDLQEALPNYKSLLDARVASGQAKGAKDLRTLDDELWSDLSNRLQTDKKNAFVTLDELKNVMRWKLARGKFRPTLPSFIASNSSQDVESITREAFSGYDSSKAKDVLKSLCRLKGVGPATGSLLLSLYDPETEAFMSDESWVSIPSLQNRKIGYTEKDWVTWREEINKRKEELAWKGSLSEFERACWAYTQSKTSTASQPDDAETSPVAAKRKADATRTSTDSKKVKPDNKKAAAKANPAASSETSGKARTTRSRAKGKA